MTPTLATTAPSSLGRKIQAFTARGRSLAVALGALLTLGSSAFSAYSADKSANSAAEQVTVAESALTQELKQSSYAELLRSGYTLRDLSCPPEGAQCQLPNAQTVPEDASVQAVLTSMQDAYLQIKLLAEDSVVAAVRSCVYRWKVLPEDGNHMSDNDNPICASSPTTERRFNDQLFQLSEFLTDALHSGR